MYIHLPIIHSVCHSLLLPNLLSCAHLDLSFAHQPKLAHLFRSPPAWHSLLVVCCARFSRTLLVPVLVNCSFFFLTKPVTVCLNFSHPWIDSSQKIADLWIYFLD